jgi:hypothetical protein
MTVSHGLKGDWSMTFEMLNCPNCPDQGWYETEETGLECCGTPLETGECCNNPVPTAEPSQVQCQFCCETPNSRFNLMKLDRVIREFHGTIHSVSK